MCQTLTLTSLDNTNNIFLKNSYRHTHMDPCPHILNPHDPAVHLWMQRIFGQKHVNWWQGAHRRRELQIVHHGLGCTYLRIHIGHRTVRWLQETATTLYCKPQVWRTQHCKDSTRKYPDYRNLSRHLMDIGRRQEIPVTYLGDHTHKALGMDSSCSVHLRGSFDGSWSLSAILVIWRLSLARWFLRFPPSVKRERHAIPGQPKLKYR